MKTEFWQLLDLSLHLRTERRIAGGQHARAVARAQRLVEIVMLQTYQPRLLQNDSLSRCCVHLLFTFVWLVSFCCDVVHYCCDFC